MKYLLGGRNFLDEAFDDIFKPVYFNKNAYDMKTDIKETENGYELDIEMAGFEKNEIEVSVENGYLSVTASKKEKTEKDSKQYVKRERSISLSRSYYVGDVSEENIKAKYNNGLLSLIVPKEVEKKPETKRITIE